MLDTTSPIPLDKLAYAAIGGLAVAVQWLYSRLRKCEERWDQLYANQAKPPPVDRPIRPKKKVKRGSKNQ